MATATTPSINALLDKEAEAHAEIDGFVEDKEAAFSEGMYDLLLSANNRNISIWEAFGAHPELTLIEYGMVEIHSRGPQWNAEVSTMVAAARMQTWVNVFGVEYLALVERNAQTITAAANRLDNKGLREAAKLGIGKARFDGAKERRNAR
jgi:hypothetical protein